MDNFAAMVVEVWDRWGSEYCSVLFDAKSEQRRRHKMHRPVNLLLLGVWKYNRHSQLETSTFDRH
jgi:hypothetical protein